MNKLKLIKTAEYLSGAIAALLVVFYFFGDAILSKILEFTIDENAVVGVIGGADGPTAIYVTSSTNNMQLEMLMVIFIAMTASLALSARHLKRSSKMNDNLTRK